MEYLCAAGGRQLAAATPASGPVAGMTAADVAPEGSRSRALLEAAQGRRALTADEQLERVAQRSPALLSSLLRGQGGR